MTFDDGIVGIYVLSNIAEAGKKPVKGLTQVEQLYFGYDVLGLNRYYTALQAHQQIAAVINVPGWITAEPNKHIAVIADAEGQFDDDQYTIRLSQPMTDEDGLRITKLTLERIGESYAVVPDSGDGSASDSDG